MGYVSTWMGDRLSSRPAVGCVSVGISLSPDFRKFWCTTRVSDGFAPVLRDQNTFWPCSGLVSLFLACFGCLPQLKISSL